MADDVNFPIDFTLTEEEIAAYAKEDLPVLEREVSAPAGPFDFVTYNDPARAGEASKIYRLATIGNWPEYKTMWKVKCKWGVCTKVPVAYRRHCTKFAFVKVSYPSAEGIEADIRSCIEGAALAAVVAAVISGGAAAGGAFEAALQGCLEAKGCSWAKKVRVTAGWDSECGKWTPY